MQIAPVPALGFAFTATLENYLAGILVSLRQPFAPRDHVVIHGNEGLARGHDPGRPPACRR